MAQPDLNLGAAASATQHGVYSGVDSPSGEFRETHHHDPLPGWRIFSATMIFIAAAANAFWSIAALASDKHFKDTELLVGSLGLWGGVLLVFAIVQVVAAVLIVKGSQTGIVLGIAIAAASMVAQLFVVGAYPIWSVFVIVLDGLVIHGLTVHVSDRTR